SSGHLERHGDAAPRQGQHDHVGPVGVLGQSVGQGAAGFGTVAEAHDGTSLTGTGTAGKGQTSHSPGGRLPPAYPVPRTSAPPPARCGVLSRRRRAGPAPTRSG